MNVSWSVAVAAVFLWLGMVLAISFLEAPLKFRAPGVTLALGLGIGRLVFRALNTCEVMLALVVAAGLYGSQASAGRWAAFAVAAAALAVQLLAVRPALSRRSDAVLASAPGEGHQRSSAHLYYVALEAIKVVALVVTGLLLFGGVG